MENKDLLKIKIDQARLKLPEDTRDAIDAVDWKLHILQMRESKGYTYTQLEDLEIETELLLCGLLTPQMYQAELEKRLNLPKKDIELIISDMNEKVFQKIRQELIKIQSTKKVKESFTETPKIKKETPYKAIEIHPKEKEVLNNLGIEIMPARTATQNVAGRPEELKGKILETKPKIEEKKEITIQEEPIVTKKEEEIPQKPEKETIKKEEPPIIVPEKPVEIKPLDIKAENLVTFHKVEKVEPIKPVTPLSASKLTTPFQTKEVTTEHSTINMSKPASNPTPAGIKQDPYREPI